MSEEAKEKTDQQPVEKQTEVVETATETVERPKEYGGPRGKEPTRYGDWERKGRCIDF